MTPPPTALDEGSLSLPGPGGVPLRLHWSLVPALWLLSPARWAVVFWAGCLAVVFVRAWAQARAARRLGCRVIALRLHGLGGDCAWSGETHPTQRGRIALSSFTAQLLLWAAATVALRAMGPSPAAWAVALGDAFHRANMAWLALQLAPFAPMDGRSLWSLPLRSLESFMVAQESKRLRGELDAMKSPPTEVRMTVEADEHARAADEEALVEAEVTPEVEAMVDQLWQDVKKREEG